MWWPLTLTYIFKVIRPWLRKSCPLCSVYSSGWILFIFGTNDHYHWRVCRVLHFFFRIWKFEFLANFLNFSALTLKKKSAVLDGFFPYLPQMITSVRGGVAYNDIPPATKLGGYIGFTLSVCPSVCLLPFRVRPVASTVHDGFFPYLVQMINSMRGCVTCDDLWPRPISSRSFGLDLENHVRSVSSTVLDGFFLYLAQMITIIGGWVACYVFFRIWKFEFLAV